MKNKRTTVIKFISSIRPLNSDCNLAVLCPFKAKEWYRKIFGKSHDDHPSLVPFILSLPHIGRHCGGWQSLICPGYEYHCYPLSFPAIHPVTCPIQSRCYIVMSPFRHNEINAANQTKPTNPTIRPSNNHEPRSPEINTTTSTSTSICSQNNKPHRESLSCPF